MELRLLTLNLHAWLEEEQEKKFEEIADFIFKNKIDIIAFQEANQHKDSKVLKENIHIDNPLNIIAELLKSKGKNYNYLWDWAHYGYDIYEEGLGILTSFPIIDSASTYISRSREKNYWKSRKVLYAKVETPKGFVNVYSCHMGWLEDKDEPFEEQMEKLAGYIKREEELSLIMGDFNNPDISRGYELIKSYDLVDLYREANKDNGYTIKGNIAGWEDNTDGLRIDYIYADRAVDKVEEAKVVFEEKPVSDHYGVYIKAEI